MGDLVNPQIVVNWKPISETLAKHHHPLGQQTKVKKPPGHAVILQAMGQDNSVVYR